MSNVPGQSTPRTVATTPAKSVVPATRIANLRSLQAYDSCWPIHQSMKPPKTSVPGSGWTRTQVASRQT